jgi:hypothetical protein
MTPQKPLTPQEHIDRADWHLSRAEAMGSHAGSALTFATAHSTQAVAKLLQAQVGSENNQAPKRKAE